MRVHCTRVCGCGCGGVGEGGGHTTNRESVYDNTLSGVGHCSTWSMVTHAGVLYLLLPLSFGVCWCWVCGYVGGWVVGGGADFM